ncbi:MAG: peptide deformylase, partial [Deltaproteobacteria bacterium]
KLIDDMFETMYAASGVGLAATQVGDGRRVIVVDVSPVEKEIPPMALVNPEIVARRGMCEASEGCLSVPGVEGIVARPQFVTVKGLNELGDAVRFEAGGLLARAVQHEIDHLDGVLFLDRLSTAAATTK